MILTDIFSIVIWWTTLLFLTVICLPLTQRIFSHFIDRGYIFSKVFGLLLLSYCMYLLGIFHLLPFTQPVLFGICLFLLVSNIVIYTKQRARSFKIKNIIAIATFEELLFFITLGIWSLIRSYQPDIHGLEKFMDYGFVNAILRSTYFPPHDMWLTPFSINYYYFGHLITAVITKLSGIPSAISYNLMIATIAAFCFSLSFSLALNLLVYARSSKQKLDLTTKLKLIAGSLLSSMLVTYGGNLHTIYTFFKSYTGEIAPAPWQLLFSPFNFPNGYWYPNATRFIYHTIHEFPLYSFVVSDLHGHVVDIPIILTLIAVLFELHISKETKNNFLLVTCSLLLAISYMTNAWDGIIYFLLIILCLLYQFIKKRFSIRFFLKQLVLIGFCVLLFVLPFSLFFKPFVSGIGILCAPPFLISMGHLGPFLFEPDHCQHSPLWQLGILYGFFYFWVIVFIIRNRKRALSLSDIFICFLIIISTILILVPEFIYAKDIYPAHYRANTMFKLVYESFIMLSLASGYTIIQMMDGTRLRRLLIGSIACLLLLFVFIYPYFAITSYYNNFVSYKGLNGTTYLNQLYPTDYAAIAWLNTHVTGSPVILEAQGDSYTDFARVSANTGLPTVLGWTVHEWLWRGTYDIPAPRIKDVQMLYETQDITITQTLLKQYNIQYVFVGILERQKYTNLSEFKFSQLGKIVYQNKDTSIYRITFEEKQSE